MDKTKRNRLCSVTVRRGVMDSTEVIFRRSHRPPKFYLPSDHALEMLEPFLTDCEILLSTRWVSITIYL